MTNTEQRRSPRPSKGSTKLKKRLSQISSMERPALTDLWYDTHGSPPAKNLSSVFLQRALVFETQCAALGGLKKRTLKGLKPAAKDAVKPKPALPVSAHLIREWNGRSYRVEVVPKGFEMNGQIYLSLSAIAKHITGAHWSGPRFFGLVNSKEAA